MSAAIPARRHTAAQWVVMLLASVVLGAAALGSPTAVAAYPPSTVTVTTDQAVYSLNAPVVITASGFTSCVGQTVTFTITPPGGGAPIVVTGVVGPDGVATITIPAGFAVSGTYRVIATCGGQQANTTFRVIGLVQTGSDIGRWLVAGGGLLMAGLAMVLVAARRRRPATVVAAA
jgi:LPXTG-motif cell wall-anchored protein